MEADRRVLRPAQPIDLALTLAPLRHGRLDPTIRIAPSAVLRATRTPDGPATLHLSAGAGAEASGEIVARAWGPGAQWALDAAPALCGLTDDVSTFAPDHPVVADLHRRRPGLRMPRSLAVLEALVPAVIEQKVTGKEARRSYHGLVRWYGEPAPGPGNLVVPPPPETLARLPSWAFHQAGIERKRADTIRIACACAGRLEEVTAMDPAAAQARLTALPGVGLWTAAEVARTALGDADAVSVGDYHLPDQVAWALAGEPRGDDERMLALLAPFPGHRGRVIRLIESAAVTAPRRGPRMPANDIRSL